MFLRRALTALFVLAMAVVGLPGMPRAASAATMPGPTNLTATVSGSSVELEWNISDPDRVVGYRIWRDGVRVGQPTTGQTAPMAAVGDIALCNTQAQISGHTAVANVVDGLPGPIALVGDMVQGNGSWNSFINCYDNQWSRHNSRSYPIPGNHEWNTPGAQPFYDYFTPRAAKTPVNGQGWLSYNVGDWKIIGLDTNCWEIEGCAVGSPQYNWLEAELASTTSPCTLVYAHQPYWRSTLPNNAVYLKPLQQLMYRYGVELYLAGDQHVYSRYAKLDPDANPDSNGIRQIIVGTGGYSHGGFGNANPPQPQTKNNTTFGALALQLAPTSYQFQFVNAPSTGSFTDSGSSGCHGPNQGNGAHFIDRNVPSGGHTYLVEAYDAAGNTSSRASVDINGGAPQPPAGAVGEFWGVVVGEGQITAAGWAADAQAGEARRVTVKVGNNRSRTSVTTVFRPASGENDRFAIPVTVGQGTHTVCVRVKLATGPTVKRLGCRTVTVGAAKPIGAFSSLAVVNGTAIAVGWGIDPDTTLPVFVQAHVNGQLVAVGVANKSRTWITSRYPGYGPDHAFRFPLPLTSGPHTVCLNLLDTTWQGGTNLGCRTVTL